MTPTPPTDRQLEVLRLVHAGENLRAIATALGMTSTNGPADHIRALVRKGLVQEVRPYAKSGRWRLTDDGLAAIGLRACGACLGAGCVSLGFGEGQRPGPVAVTSPPVVPVPVAPPASRVAVLKELVSKRSAGGRR